MKKITIIIILIICVISTVIYTTMYHHNNCINMNKVEKIVTVNGSGFLIKLNDGNGYYFENKIGE